MRYGPTAVQIKDLLMSGVIGNVLSVDFCELLNTRHGADYFRRWHRNKANSGGLLVHKATHHFDAINWWLSDIPVGVFGMGYRKFYTPEQAVGYGLKHPAERCLNCPESGKCPFYFDLMMHAEYKALYFDNEQYDGYYRDRCVFSKDIDIEDSMELVVSYEGGTKLSYSLNAFAPLEGLSVAFNGSKGRLELKDMHEVDSRGTVKESVDVRGGDSTPGFIQAESTSIIVYPHFKQPYQVEPWTAEGSHGGADPQIVADLFGPAPAPDKYRKLSDQRAGAYSILVGIAGNISIERGELVRLADLVSDIGRPDFPHMPIDS
jgi:predicted dehydrogenase